MRRVISVVIAVGVALSSAIASPTATVSARAAINVVVPCSGTGGGTAGLVAGIEAANASGGGTITLAQGCTYTLTTGPFDDGAGPAGLPIITASVIVTGNGSSIVRDGTAPKFRLLEVGDSASASLALDRVTLSGGNTDGTGDDDSGGGGAILNAGTLAVTNSTFTGNAAVNGGAIGNHVGGTVDVTSTTFSGNHGTNGLGSTGGAIFNSGGVFRIYSSVISGNNSTTYGGGIHNSNSSTGTLAVTNSTVSGNSTTLASRGGGISNNGTLAVTNSTISGNSAVGYSASGGGIWNSNAGTLAVTNSTISGNSTGVSEDRSTYGGGLANFGAATVTSSTIAGNSANGPDGLGGGLANDDDDGATLTATSSIVADNPVGGNCTGAFDDGSFNLENGTTCGFANQAVNAEPLLAPLAANGGPTQTQALQPGSPAINHVPLANPACSATNDQRGVNRPQGAGCDIGAFEVVATTTSLSAANPATIVKPVELTATVTGAAAIPGRPTGTVNFYEGATLLGSAVLSGGVATLSVALGAATHSLTASYQQSNRFLSSTSTPLDLTVTRAVQLPRRCGKTAFPNTIKSGGKTVLLPRTCRTNARQEVQVRVTGRPHLSGRGDGAFFGLLKGPRGRISIQTFGHQLRVTITYSAPKKGKYAAYRRIDKFNT